MVSADNMNENDGVDPKVAHLIRSLANDVHLRLCSDSRLTKHFHALIRTAFPLKAQESHGTSYLSATTKAAWQSWCSPTRACHPVT